MKFITLRKKILIEAGTAGAILLGLLVVSLLINGLSNRFTDDKNLLNGQVISLTTEANTLQAQVVKAKESLLLYETLNKQNQNAGFDLNRQKAKDLLDKLKNNARLSSLSLTMAPIAKLNDPNFKTKAADIISSDVTLNFEGLTDEQLYSFISAIKLYFPGYVRVNSLELTRQGELTNETFASISKGILPALVKGQLAFKWLGLKYIAKPSETAKADNGN